MSPAILSLSHILHHGVACTVYKTWSPNFILSLAAFLLCNTHKVSAYVCAICSNEDNSQGGGGGEGWGKVYVIFYAKGKESHGSGRCWLERCVYLQRWSVPSLKSRFYFLFAINSIFVENATCRHQTYRTSLALCLCIFSVLP